MPQIQFDAMPSSARVWVFGASEPITGSARDSLLAAVDAHLAQWTAHGAPLVCAREWRDDRFLVVAVDEAATGASGCSIDGLFRVLAQIESTIGASLVESGAVYWRASDGQVIRASRPDFRTAAAQGAIDDATTVFDTTVNTIGAWRAGFERAAGTSWHAQLLRR